MIEDLVSYVFGKIGHVWKTDQGFTQPTPEDVREVLDMAAQTLYTEPQDTAFRTGGIIVEKVDGAKDVYVYVGTY